MKRKSVKLYTDKVLETFYDMLLRGNVDNLHIPHSDVFYVRAACEAHFGEKFTLERISVLIQQNKWQMEMLRRFYEQRNEHKRKFAELYDHKIEQQIKEAEQRGSKKWNKN